MTTRQGHTVEEQSAHQQLERWRSWRNLLEDAVRTPGLLHAAYRQFPGYSVRNQLLAMAQCSERELLPGPLGTFVFWQRLGRNVKKGERALTLCVPITIKRKNQSDEDSDSAEEESVMLRGFSYRRGWFTVHQTTGSEVALPSTPDWNAARALAEFQISIVPFEDMDGNKQGYAQHGKISISPIAALPHKTLLHELAHLALKHHETPSIPRAIREVEAESVALLLLEALELPGAAYSRGYLQHWLRNEELTEATAQRIITCADKILAAGRPPCLGRATLMVSMSIR